MNLQVGDLIAYTDGVYRGLALIEKAPEYFINENRDCVKLHWVSSFIENTPFRFNNEVYTISYFTNNPANWRKVNK